MKDLQEVRRFPGGKAHLFMLMASVFLAVAIIGCGGNDASSQIKDLINKAARAGEGISSYRMSLVMFLETGQTDSIKTDEMLIAINGNDVSLKETFYSTETDEGTVVQESIRVGDRQYSRDITNQQWTEVEPSPIEEAAASYTSHIGDFISYSSSAEIVGDENVNGVMATHIRFQLSVQDVASLLPSTPQSNLDTNQGGQVDIWIDKGIYYPVKYDMLFRNVLVGEEFGYADVRIVIDITDINNPIEITPPPAAEPQA
jgi:outer membrane lipoprotein-sorting protein